MAQIDDLRTAIQNDLNDTQTFIGQVAAEVASLQNKIDALQATINNGTTDPDLTDVIASVNSIDNLVKNTTVGSAPAAPAFVGLATQTNAGTSGATTAASHAAASQTPTGQVPSSTAPQVANAPATPAVSTQVGVPNPVQTPLAGQTPAQAQGVAP